MSARGVYYGVDVGGEKAMKQTSRGGRRHTTVSGATGGPYPKVFKKLGVLQEPQRQTEAGCLWLKLRLIPLSSKSRKNTSLAVGWCARWNSKFDPVA